ncbi:unnamed protein product [Lymnaea stagnalis]|uniref:acylglycerol lipase n=1 Tax=Lymnaea stagnalis TaxID=6523 RepID=A0AAV2H1M5_LYMST
MSGRKQKRVGPAESNSSLIEIRPSRILRIQHFNSRPRDDKFEKEMQLYTQYRKKNISSSGPLTMPKKHKKDFTNKIPQQNLKSGTSAAEDSHDNNSESQSDCHASKRSNMNSPGKNTISPLSSLTSSPSHLNATAEIRSASSVQLALRNKMLLLNNQENTLTKTSQESSKNTLVKIQQLNHGTGTNLDLALINNFQMEGDESYSCPPGALSLPTREKKHNDASFYPELFKKQKHKESSSSDSVDGPSTSSENYIVPVVVDKDLVLFFIHGVGGSSDVWYSQAQYFANLGYEVVIPDLIGHGFSFAPRNAKAYHFKEIAADLEEVFDKYCKRRNIIIGHSYGASFATFLARNRPRRVNKLILISGGPPTPLAPQAGVFTLPYCMLACIKPCLVCGFHKGAFHKTRTPVIPKEEAFNIPAYVLQNIMNGQDWPDGDELFHNWVTCPCLLIYGAQDQLVSLSDEEDMAQVIFDSKLEVIKDASHMVMIEAPDEVNQLLEKFILKSVDPASSLPQNSNALQSESNSSLPAENLKTNRSLKSARSQHSLPQNLLSKSITG